MTPEEIGGNVPIVFGPEAQPNAVANAGHITRVCGYSFQVQANGDLLMNGHYLVPQKEWDKIRWWIGYGIGFNYTEWVTGNNGNSLYARIVGQSWPGVKILQAVQRIINYNSGMPT